MLKCECIDRECFHHDARNEPTWRCNNRAVLRIEVNGEQFSTCVECKKDTDIVIAVRKR